MDSPDQQGQQHPGQQVFATDEELDRRLQQVENCLANMEAGIPAMRREIRRLRELLFPSLHRQAA